MSNDVKRFARCKIDWKLFNVTEKNVNRIDLVETPIFDVLLGNNKTRW